MYCVRVNCYTGHAINSRRHIICFGICNIANYFDWCSNATSSKKWDTVCPKEISIDDDSIYIVGDAFNHHRATNDIKKIIDTGDCYRIIFTFPNKSVYCLCQKDLIVEGSIEEFEERFADYIVRKTK